MNGWIGRQNPQQKSNYGKNMIINMDNKFDFHMIW